MNPRKKKAPSLWKKLKWKYEQANEKAYEWQFKHFILSQLVEWVGISLTVLLLVTCVRG